MIVEGIYSASVKAIYRAPNCPSNISCIPAKPLNHDGKICRLTSDASMTPGNV